MQDQTVAAKPPRRLRRLLIGVALLSISFFIVLASTPTLLSTSPARGILTRQINKKLQPGRITLGGASLSWTRGLLFNDVALLDPSGKIVATAESVRTERGLLALLTSRSDYGTIWMAGATADIERRADGSVDVLDALGGLTGADEAESHAGNGGFQREGVAAGASPGLAVTVMVDGGRIRIASPELAEPITASAFDGHISIVPGKPLAAEAKLIGENCALELHADYAMGTASGNSADLSLNLQGADWPLTVHEAGVRAQGRLVGGLKADRTRGLWSARGDAVLRGFVADGPVLAGDRLALDAVTTACDVEQTTSGWSIRKLDLKSSIGQMTAVGEIPAAAGTVSRLKGHIDLAEAARLLPHRIPLRPGLVIDQGQARLDVALNLTEGTERFTVSADLTDLAATRDGRPLTLRKPVSLSGALTRVGGDIAVESFGLKAAGVQAVATGDLEHGLKVSGTIDLAVVEKQAREWIEVGALSLAGKGRMAADYRPEGGLFKARLAAELDGLRIAGLTDEPIDRDHVRIEGAADGPRGESGVPTNWRAIRLGVTAGATRANLLARTTGGVATFDLDGSTPITTPASAIASGKVTLRRSGRVLDLDAVHLVATPTDPQAASAAIALTAKGSLDLDAGRLVLIPVGPQPSAGIAVGPQGFMLTGVGKPERPMNLDAVLVGELSALDRTLAYWTQSSLWGLGGTWSGRLTGTRQADGRFQFQSRTNSPNFTMTTQHGPVGVTLAGTYSPAEDILDLSNFELATAYARLAGRGTVAEIGARRLADVTALVEPHWETLDPLVAAAVEPGARIRATVKPFHLKGSLAAGSTSQILKGMEGALAVDLASAQTFGMQVGPTPVVLRMGGGRAVFDPVSTTINNGEMEMSAQLGLDDPASIWLLVAEGSKIDGASINKAVSDDVLSYIAPVLDKAGDISGKVSLTVVGASIPLTGAGALRVDGQLVFDDVAFQPGPLASELVSLTGESPTKLTLRQPLQLQIADGRVRQSGLSIPVADVQVKLGGSVGFDKTLAMRASVPITPRMLGGNAAVQQFVGGTEIAIPIGGTISHPTIDRNGLRLALKDAARSMVRRGVQAEAGRLIERALPSAAEGRRANPSGGSFGRDALKILEGVGRDLAQPDPR
ncbi:hypothetical protein [Planctomyces sp. SH-PL62]|uniref:hypothetical protein n=1 Tax=Planctomyces sp. SH-PL62 TaxID=1636152 RepID=UPI00078C4246|nr:hypothetical protein [Planctomyces sp. SH-PL62]AMV39195.1 hypothetical protein VT85_17290 [Planctomyces sp. SH-PL62]